MLSPAASKSAVRVMTALQLELADRLELQSAATGAPKSELIRRALSQYLPSLADLQAAGIKPQG
jgi:predicted DNA-binding protein